MRIETLGDTPLPRRAMIAPCTAQKVVIALEATGTTPQLKDSGVSEKPPPRRTLH